MGDPKLSLAGLKQEAVDGKVEERGLRSLTWRAWFENLDLRKMIRQDVQRTFSDIDYFRQAATQDRLTDILFVCCKLSPEIGYRQGMHELLAPLRLHVDFDSFPSTAAEDSLADVVLSHAHVEHDTLALLSPVMHSARICYDHTPYVRVSPKTSRQHVVPPPHPPRHRA
ncbi:hypothetical protein JCM10296v2_007335 [Rhodotorula toruloides]